MEFADLHDYIEKKQTNICQMCIMKDGKIVFSDEWNGYKADDTCHVMSVTKSIVSLLIGIAIDNGIIESVDQKVLDFFPEYNVKRGEKTIQNVTVRHLLTMTAPYKFKSEPWTKICTSPDWTTATLDFLGGRNGITGDFRYSTLGIHILTGILARQSGMDTVDFAQKYLFGPVGIDKRENYVAETAQEHKAFTLSKAPHGKVWFADPNNVGTAGYGLCMSAEEMVKLGQLCLQGGMWETKPIVSKSWLKEMTAPTTINMGQFRGMKYGYLWWIIDDEKSIYAAIGNSGNVIYINPEKNMTVAISAYFKPTVFDRIDFIRQIVEPIF